MTGALSKGTDVVFRVDIQGAQTVRRVFPDAVSLFLVGPVCPSNALLAERLRGPGQLQVMNMLGRRVR